MALVRIVPKYLPTSILLGAVAMGAVASAGCDNNQCQEMGEALELDKAAVYAMLQPEGGAGTDDSTGVAADDGGALADGDDADAAAASAAADAAAAAGDAADGASSPSGDQGLACPTSEEVSAYVGLKYDYGIAPSQIGTPSDEGTSCVYPIQAATCAD